MEPDLRLTDLVRGSLAAFADPGRTGRGVGAALHFGFAGAPQVMVDRVDVLEPEWDPTGGGTWARMLEVTLRIDIDSDEAARSIQVPVPWLVDDRARAQAPGGITVGGHEGLMVDGLMRIPTHRLVRRPGVHLLQTAGPAPGSRLAIEAGPLGRCVLRKPSGGLVEVAGTGVFGRGRWRTYRWAGAASDRQPDLAAFLTGLAERPGLAWALPEDELNQTAEAVLGAGRPGAADSAWLAVEDVEALLTRLAAARRAARSGALAPGARVELDHGLWRQVTYGDDLARAVFVAARRAARAMGDSPSPDARVLLFRRQLRTAIHDVATGSGAYRGGVIARPWRNLVDMVEQHRTVRFVGPDGLEPVSGRMDLRSLPPGWRDRLCPVHTPESKDVGFVRHAALGVNSSTAPTVAGYSDLSVAAALVPYVGHDDPTRVSIVSKMFGQALVVDGRQGPGVRTGIEGVVAASVGLARAPHAGAVRSVGADHVTVGTSTVWFGPGGGSPGAPSWTLDVEPGDFLASGDVVAHAPDVVLEPDGACLALGVDALVAFLPWHGWNYEDGVVVCESFAQRTASQHVVAIEAPYDADGASGAVVHELLLDPEPGELAAGTPLFVVVSGGARRMYRLPESGTPLPAPVGSPFGFVEVVSTARGQRVARMRYRSRRVLEVGDKLTTRHGGKGVVTCVLPDADMPRLPDDTPVEVLLNPLGVLRRLNIGTMLELGAGLARRLSHETTARVVPRALGAEERAALRDELERLGAPGGRLKLTLPDGEPVGSAEGVLVGDLHLLKLDHLARPKAVSRDDAVPSPVTLQPVRTAQWREYGRAGAPQRLGEMEVWALQALGAQQVLSDLVHDRGEGDRRLRGARLVAPGLRAAAGNLAIGGIGLQAVLPDGLRLVAEAPGLDAGDVQGFRVAWIGSGEPSESLRDLATVVRPDASARVAAVAAVRHTLEPEPGVVDPRALAEAAQSVRWFLRLPEPVPHPWSTREQILPCLEVLRLPPAAVLGSDDDPLRVALTAVVELSISVGKAKPADASEVKARLRDSVRALLGGPETPPAVPWLPAAVPIFDRLTGKYGLLRRNVLGSAAIHSARLVLTGDPDRPVHTIGLPQSVLDSLRVPELSKGYEDVVLLNRSPTLHPYSIIALRAQPADGHTARVHPYLLKAIAGDFDGDTVAIHRPVTEPARAELWDRARLAANARTAATGGLLAKLDLDVALGWHLRSRGTKNLAREVSEVLGDEPDEARLGAVADLMRTGWEEARGWGFSVVDLPSPEGGTLDEVLGLDRPAVRRVRDAYLAGVAGSEADLSQLLLARGDVLDPNPLHPAASVEGCYLDGLADEDYFAAAQQSIGALAAKKLVTPHAGALTRSLVRLGQDCVVVAGDCGTTVEPRSPLTCREERREQVCQACYGADRATGRDMEPGRRVGVLAGMLIGERSTQLAMKSIHDRGRGEPLGARVSDLSGIFGAGSFARRVPDPDHGVPGGGRKTVRFRAYADAVDGALPEDALGTLLAEFHERLHDLDQVHAAVLLRMLAIREANEWHYRSRREAEAARGALSRAAWHGALEPLVAALDEDLESPDLLVRDLILGGEA